MRKSLAVSLTIVVIFTVFICYKFGPRNAATTAQNVSVQAATPIADSTPPPMASEIPAVTSVDVSNDVASDSSPTNSGLIKLQFRPTVSNKLPSAEDAQKAWAMNTQMMSQMRGQAQVK